MKILVVGFGSIGSTHAVNAKVLGHEVFVYDPLRSEADIKARFASANVVPGYVVDDYDAVIVATPASEHSKNFDLAASKPTLIEKPLAMTSEEAARCPATANVVRVGYNLRFHPAYRYLLEAVPNLGRIAHATFAVHCDKSKWPGAKYESMLVEASHEIDLALWTLGPAEVRGVVKASDDCWTILLRHEIGAATTVVLDGNHKASYRRLASIIGENGAATSTWNGPANNWQWAAVKTGSQMISGQTAPDDTYREELKEFLELAKRGIVDDAGVGATVGESVDVLKICDAAEAEASRP